MRRIVLALLAGLLALPVQAEDTPSIDVVVSIRTKSEVCNIQSSKRVSLAELLSARDSLHSSCVTVEGYVAGFALFADRSQARSKNSSKAEFSNVRIGLYGEETVMRNLASQSEGQNVRVTGTLFECEDLHAAGAIMVLGYCHSSTGPIIAMSAFETVSD